MTNIKTNTTGIVGFCLCALRDAVFIISVSLGFALIALLIATPLTASAATSSTINFQARLESSGGAIAPDGTYDITFHLFNSSTAVGGTSTNTGCGTDTTCEWTEQYTYNSGAGATDVRLRVANGYLTVNLGSITAFPSTINWDQQQWLTMDVGGTTGSGAITWDGQMSPRILMTATPYAFAAGQLQVTNGANVAKLVMTAAPSANYTITVPNETGTVCTTAATGACSVAGSGYVQLAPAAVQTDGVSGVSSIFINKTVASGSLLELQRGGSDVFNVGNTGNITSAATSVQFNAGSTVTEKVVTGATGTQLTIQGGSANTGNNVGGNLLLQGGAGSGSGASGSVVVQANGNNSTTAFQVQNAAGTAAVLNVDTTNSQVSLRNLNDVGSIGAELFTASESLPNVGAWSGSGTGSSATSTHSSGADTTALVASPAITTSAGQVYQVSYTLSGGTGGTVKSKIGATTGRILTADGTTQTQVDIITATGVGNLQFVPTGTFDGTISNVSVKLITIQTPSLVGNDSTGATANELRVSTSANSNLGFGQFALLANAGGTSNTAVGQSALSSLTTANNNTAFGYRALADNTTGGGNTAVGTQALSLSSVSTQNTAVGYQSLQNTSSGQQNVAVGNVSMNANTYGSNNTALGWNTLGAVTTTSNNTAIGSLALTNTTGQNNTAVGAQALMAITTGNQDVAIGYRTGNIDNQQTDFKTLGTITGATMIGGSAQAVCSNCVILGGQGQDWLQGGVGIGTPNPTNYLSAEPLEYNTGTVATDGSTGNIVGTGTSWNTSNNVRVGDEIYIASNSATTATFKGTITAITDNTHLTMSTIPSLVLSGAHYYVLHTGLQVKSTGEVYTAGTSTVQFQVQNSSAASILDVDTSTTVNLVTNGDFENGNTTTGWTALSGATLTRDTSQHLQGNSSLKIATTTAANDGAMYTYIPAASTQYTLSFYAKVASGTITDFGMGHQDNTTNGKVDCFTNQPLTTSWARYTCTYTTSATINTAFIYAYKSSTTAENFFIDGVQVQTGATATPFDAGGRLQLNGIINSPVVIQDNNGGSNNTDNASPLTVIGGQNFLDSIVLDTAATGEQAVLGFESNKSLMWRLGKDTDDSFNLWDNTNSQTVLQAVATSKTLYLGNSGMTVQINGNSSTFANLTLSNAHVISTQTTAPTIGTPTNCGTGATAAMGTGATDSAGSFRITAGGTGSPTTCDTVVTFNKAYGAAPKSILVVAETVDGGTGSASARQIYVSASSTTTFTVKMNSAATNSEVNWFYYWVIQ